MTSLSRQRNSPLEDIERQPLKITDLKVTLLSVEYPPEEQLRVVRNIWWKSDSIIVELFTRERRSATLSSLGIGLEASQGATQRVFQQIQRDIGAGAVAIRALSDAGGEMSEEFVSQFGDAYQRIQNLAAIANTWHFAD